MRTEHGAVPITDAGLAPASGRKELLQRGIGVPNCPYLEPTLGLAPRHALTASSDGLRGSLRSDSGSWACQGRSRASFEPTREAEWLFRRRRPPSGEDEGAGHVGSLGETRSDARLPGTAPKSAVLVSKAVVACTPRGAASGDSVRMRSCAMN